MSTCFQYDMRWWHFIFPFSFEYKILCDSYDKTYMFIVVVIRLIFWALIFNFLRDRKLIEFDRYMEVQYFFFVLFLLILSIYTFNVLMVSFKKQSNLQKQVEIKIEIPPEPIKPLLAIQVFRDPRSKSSFELGESDYDN
jgi:hypothetical protein